MYWTKSTSFETYVYFDSLIGIVVKMKERQQRHVHCALCTTFNGTSISIQPERNLFLKWISNKEFWCVDSSFCSNCLYKYWLLFHACFEEKRDKIQLEWEKNHKNMFQITLISSVYFNQRFPFTQRGQNTYTVFSNGKLCKFQSTINTLNMKK